MQTASIMLNAPALLKIKTVGDNEHFINSNMIVSMSKTQDADTTDVVLLNGQKYVIQGDLDTNASNYAKTVNETGKNLDLTV